MILITLVIYLINYLRSFWFLLQLVVLLLGGFNSLNILFPIICCKSEEVKHFFFFLVFTPSTQLTQHMKIHLAYPSQPKHILVQIFMYAIQLTKTWAKKWWNELIYHWIMKICGTMREEMVFLVVVSVPPKNLQTCYPTLTLFQILTSLSPRIDLIVLLLYATKN